MSAYICDPATFKTLALFATERRHGGWVVDPRYVKGLGINHPIETADRLTLANLYADALYRENVRSVGHRYADTARDGLPGPIADAGHVTVTNRDLDAARRTTGVPALVILKTCDCLEYQSCETEDYRTTAAYDLLNTIRRAAIRQLPGYDEAAGW